MTHLFVELYDRPAGRLPCCTLDDHDVSHRQYFHDLTQRGVANRAARVVVRCGDEYHPGDHIRLLDKVRRSHTDTVVVDPLIAPDVNLNELLFNNQGFAERADAVLIMTNPNPDSSFRLRLSLYDQVEQRWPSLIFYDWEYPQGFGPTDLAQFHFTHRAAFIRLETGPDYKAGDKVTLWATLEPGTQATYTLEPGDYNLTQFLPTPSEVGAEQLLRPRTSWAEILTAIEFKLQPRLVRH